MEGKKKRLRKIMVKKGFKGELKPVSSIEEAHLICIENGQNVNKTVIIDINTYRQWLEEGHTFPEDTVHYVVHSNPRNVRNIQRKFLSNANGVLRSRLPT